MNRVVRKNLRVKLGDVVSIHNTGEVPYGKGQSTGTFCRYSPLGLSDSGHSQEPC